MTLYGRSRDASLFRSINREIINEIIDTKVDIIKPIIDETKANLYGESTQRVWNIAVRLYCIISINEQEASYDEFGVDVNQTGRFAFLRDDLVKANIVIDVGDIIHWNNRYWEIDKEVENQYFMKRNPATEDKDEDGNWILEQDQPPGGTEATWDDDNTINDTDVWQDDEEFYGWNVSMIFEAHETRKSRIQIEDPRTGPNDM